MLLFDDVPAAFDKCRYAVKTLMWSLGVQVEVLNMSASSNVSTVSSVDFHNRSAACEPLAMFCVA